MRFRAFHTEISASQHLAGYPLILLFGDLFTGKHGVIMKSKSLHKVLVVAIVLTLGGLAGCSTTPAPVAPLASPPVVQSFPTVNSLAMFDDPWYQDFLRDHNRIPTMEVVLFGRYGSQQEYQHRLEEAREQDATSSNKLPPALSKVPAAWVPCLDNQTVARLNDYYMNYHRAMGEKRDPVTWASLNVWMSPGMRTCVNNLGVKDFSRWKKLQHKKVMLVKNKRKNLEDLAWVIEGRILRSRKASVVSIGERGFMSAERYFSMKHASSSTAQEPGQVMGADVVLEVSRSLMRIVDVSNNQILWVGQ